MSEVEIVKDNYVRGAVVEKITDGDTIVVLVDLGHDIGKTNVKLRFLEIDAPEIRGESRIFGLESKRYVESVIPVGTEITIRTEKHKKEVDSFGRWLAHIWYFNQDGKQIYLNKELVDKNLAIEYVR